MLMSFAGTSALNYAFGIAVGWLLVPGDYGLVGFGQTIILICGLVLNSGLAWSLTTQIAATHDRETWASLVRGGLVANFALSLVLALGIIVLFQTGILRNGLETWQVALATAIALPFLSVIAIVSGTLRGIQSFSNLALILVVEVVFKAGSGILLAKMGYGAAGALFGFAVGGMIAVVVGLWRVRAVTGMTLRGKMVFLSFKMTGDMFGALIGMALLLNVDIIAVKLTAGNDRELAGFYQSATMLANMPYYLATAIFSVMFAQLAHLRGSSRLLAVVSGNLRIILLFFVPIEIGMIISPEHILGLIFPPAYLLAAPILRLLATGNLLLILTGLLSTTFQAAGDALVPAIIFGFAVVLECIALVVIVPSSHMEGASVIFSLTCALTLIAQFFVFERFMPKSDWIAVLEWFGRYALCLFIAVLVYFVCVRVFDQFLVSASIAGLVYLAGLFVMGLQQIPISVHKILVRAEL